jgi:hypothetical protein
MEVWTAYRLDNTGSIPGSTQRTDCSVVHSASIQCVPGSLSSAVK